MLSAPRIVDIAPQAVDAFIESIAVTVYDFAREQGGTLPYTIIREVAENFIHAGFAECTVSILDGGNTLRFADQGPGISKKQLVVQPGVSSATAAMKRYIRGVGSGFPLVREYLTMANGFMEIHDNAEEGTVITLSVVGTVSAVGTVSTTNNQPPITAPYKGVTSAQSSLLEPLITANTVEATKTTSSSLSLPAALPALTEREERALLFLEEKGMLGPGELAQLLKVSAPTSFRVLQRLEEYGMVECTPLKKRILSNAGLAHVQTLLG